MKYLLCAVWGYDVGVFWVCCGCVVGSVGCVVTYLFLSLPSLPLHFIDLKLPAVIYLSNTLLSKGS